MERAGLTFTVHCPPLAATAFVDRDMWEKIVLNLVSNAFKYTLAGEVAVSLSLTEDKQFLLTVRDTGIGVPAEEVPRLFERFHRVEGQHGRTQEGSGIGLALVNELVRLHGGTVRVDSALGQGSVFTVAIPSGSHHLPRDRIGAAQTLSSTALRAEAFVEEALRWLPDAATASGVSLGEPELSGSGPTTNNATDRPRVLLADDNADMRDYIQRLLAPRYDVIAVPDGQAAVDAARAQAPDLVLSDVMMPRIDGFGVLRALRADPALRDLPIVLLSARAGEEAKVEGLAAGADDYLVKPFSARELLARVDVNLQMSRLRRLSALRERDLRTEAEFMRARFESVLQHLPIAIALADADGKVVLTNPALDRMLRHAAIPTANVADLAKWHAIHTDGRHFAVADYPLARALRGEDVRDVEHLYRRGDGTLAWQLSSGIPIRNADGAVVGALVASLDIDAQKRAEVELRSLNETLEQRVAAEIAQRLKAEEASRQSQKMEAIGQLTGGVAHDFNNLLQVILGNIDTVQRRYANKGPLHRDADFRRLTDAVLRGAERGATLTQQLLAFSRRQPLEPKPIDANKLVSGMSDLIRRTLGERISVETILAGGLWRVSADANQLETALLNLALNARDAMPRGGKLTVETANAFLDDAYAETHDEVEPGQYVLIAMSDTGEGMNAEIIARAFEPFFTTKEIGRGTGLGLSQVYGFVKQSGGHVKIYSEIAEGTTVKLYLPRLISGDATIVGPSETLAPRGERGETILVVEDDPDVRSYSAGLLRELGYAVIEAADGTIALGFLDTLINVDLLFTDVGLPGGVNGRQLADEARRRHPGLKVLFTTGYARNAIVHQGRLDPGVDLIGKPFTFSGLANKVRQMLAETDDR
jgi:PAS domain S-box-containing protein